MKIKLEMAGLRDLEKALGEIESQYARKAVVRKALLAGAQPIADAARVMVPVNEGRLRDAITVSTKQPKPKRNPHYYGVVVGLEARGEYRKLKKPQGVRDYAYGSPPEVYGKFIEFGTVRQAARPFMRSAWDAEGGAKAIARIAEGLKVEIRKAVDRQARRKR